MTKAALALFVGLFIGQQLTTFGTGVGSTVGSQSYVEQSVPNPNGSIQGLEGYTRVSHTQGTVALALGTIGNLELAHTGDLTRARALQGGIVVSDTGYTAQATTLYLSGPQRKSGYTGPINIDRIDYVTFDNGWSIRPQGAALVLCDAASHCHAL